MLARGNGGAHARKAAKARHRNAGQHYNGPHFVNRSQDWRRGGSRHKRPSILHILRALVLKKAFGALAKA